MRVKGLSVASLIISSAIVLSACAGGGGAETNTAGSVTTNSGTQATPVSAALDAPFQATDLNQLPETAKKRTDTVIVGLTDPSGAFTPYFHQSGYDGNVASLLFASLVTVDEKGLPVPDLAESWDVSDDQCTYTFHLRKDSKFSDGSALTADDVAFTWTILHDKSYDGGFDIFSTKVKGGKAYTEGKADHIEGIKVIDPLTISVTLEQPNATALLTLGSEVLSKAYYGKDYQFGKLEYIKNLHATPVGNGPYKLEKFIPGQEVRFVANEFYYKGKPKTEHFIYKTSEGDTWQFIETGEIDFTSFTATQENIDKLKKSHTSTFCLTHQVHTDIYSLIWSMNSFRKKKYVKPSPMAWIVSPSMWTQTKGQVLLPTSRLHLFPGHIRKKVLIHTPMIRTKLINCWTTQAGCLERMASVRKTGRSCPCISSERKVRPQISSLL